MKQKIQTVEHVITSDAEWNIYRYIFSVHANILPLDKSWNGLGWDKGNRPLKRQHRKHKWLTEWVKEFEILNWVWEIEKAWNSGRVEEWESNRCWTIAFYPHPPNLNSFDIDSEAPRQVVTRIKFDFMHYNWRYFTLTGTADTLMLGVVAPFSSYYY